MKRKITRFKDLKIALKELEPFIRNIANGKTSVLESGRPIKKFGGMLPRELVANWLLTVVGNYFTQSERFQFTTDPDGSDGLIYDTVTQEAVSTEHIITRSKGASDTTDAQTKILNAVEQKIAKGGAAYARGKTLVVFMFSGADGTFWYPDKVAAALPSVLHFEAVWVVSFQRLEGDDPVYAVTRLDLRKGHAPVWWVRIAADFESWTVSETPPPAGKASSQPCSS
jgi:hypothetical protein